MIRAVRSGRATTCPAASPARISAISTVALAIRTIIGLMPVVLVGDTTAGTRPRASGDATSIPSRGADVAAAEPAELALAGVEGGDRLDQVLLVEIRPQGVG